MEDVGLWLNRLLAYRHTIHVFFPDIGDNSLRSERALIKIEITSLQPAARMLSMLTPLLDVSGILGTGTAATCNDCTMDEVASQSMYA